MKFKTILVDDEPLAVQRLLKLLEPFSDTIEIIKTANGGREAVQLIDELKPDLVFLDIQMPEISGLEVLGKIHHQPIIIFATAYDQYALEAFKANSIDYLLKPIEASRLEQSIEKLHKITKKQTQDIYQQIEAIIPRIKQPRIKWIQVRTGDKIQLLNPADIYFFTADEKYVRVHTFEHEFLISQTLSALEQDLDDHFVRIHRASLVNLNHIEEIFKMFKGSYKVRMKDSARSELLVSRHSKYKLGLV